MAEPGKGVFELITEHTKRFGSTPFMGYSDEALLVLIPKALERGEAIRPADEFFDYADTIII